MEELSLKMKVSKPTFVEILKKVSERNETAAVDIYGRLLLGLIGLVGAVVVFVFADPSDKMLGVVFLFIPTLPVAWGVSDDYFDARLSLQGELAGVEK